MKKYLAIFLLALLSLQFSWAAVVGYWQHETSVTAKHLGHHTHKHQSADHQESSKNTSPSTSMDHDCVTCHLCCTAALTTNPNTTTLATTDSHQLFVQSSISQLYKQRPERPKWPLLA
jgi:hypothetical protein